jgi:carboxyl-terminal processing protease
MARPALRRGTFTGVAVLLALVAGFLVGSADRPPSGVLDEAAQAISDYGAKPIDTEILRRAAVEGMLRATGDRWSNYYDQEEYSTYADSLSGRYSGIGVWLRPGAGGGTEIASVQPRSPSARVGLQAGDSLLTINGTDISTASVPTVVAALRGEVGSALRVTVLRQGIRLDRELKRGDVSSGDVTIDRYGKDVLIIRVAAFTRGVGAEVSKAVKRISHQGGIVLDLRGNPGGILEEARQTASVFLDGGVVVSYERRGLPAQLLESDDGGNIRTPLVVMVDSNTASAAEVVAGALQDRNRAVVIGARTYGKGSVQESKELSDGTAIELTVGRFRTPAGRYLEGVGIEPDVAVIPSLMRQRALQILGALITVAGSGGRG